MAALAALANIPRWAWVAGILGGGAAVAGVAYAASGGGSQPAATPSKPGSGAPGGGTVTNPGPTTSPSQVAGVNPAASATIVSASQNALATVAKSGKVPGLTYTVPASGGSGNPADADFVAALQVFQNWENAKGGYTPPGGTAVKLNTNGTLDFATIAAVMTEAVS